MRVWNSSSDILAVSKLAAFLYKRSRSSPNKWLKRHFRWDGNKLTYHHSDKMGAAAMWFACAEAMSSVTLQEDETNSIRYILQLQLFDGTLLEMGSKEKVDILLWFSSLGKAIKDVEKEAAALEKGFADLIKVPVDLPQPAQVVGSDFRSSMLDEVFSVSKDFDPRRISVTNRHSVLAGVPNQVFDDALNAQVSAGPEPPSIPDDLAFLVKSAAQKYDRRSSTYDKTTVDEASVKAMRRFTIMPPGRTSTAMPPPEPVVPDVRSDSLERIKQQRLSKLYELLDTLPQSRIAPEPTKKEGSGHSRQESFGQYPANNRLSVNNNRLSVHNNRLSLHKAVSAFTVGPEAVDVENLSGSELALDGNNHRSSVLNMIAKKAPVPGEYDSLTSLQGTSRADRVKHIKETSSVSSEGSVSSQKPFDIHEIDSHRTSMIRRPAGHDTPQSLYSPDPLLVSDRLHGASPAKSTTSSLSRA